MVKTNFALIVVAGAVFAAPVAAQQNEQPGADVARVFAAMDVCRSAPAGRKATFELARSKGFIDPPPGKQHANGYEVVMRDGIWLRPLEPNVEWGSGGSCEVAGPAPAGLTIEQVEAALEQKLGVPGVIEHPKYSQAKSWRIDGRYIKPSIVSGDLHVFMGYPVPSPADIAAARDEKKRQAEVDLAARKAAIIPAPPADFGTAAAACVAAVGPSGLELGKLDRLGWTAISLGNSPDQKNFAFYRVGSPVKIYLSTRFVPKGQCVVDGYGQSPGQFGAIAGEIKTQFGIALNKKVKSVGSTSSPGGYSRGEGYVADGVVALVSSENHPEGMNVRITIMRLDPSKDPEAFASDAGMAAQFLPQMIEAQIAKAPKPVFTPQSSSKP